MTLSSDKFKYNPNLRLDELSQLQECSFRGISFPVQTLSLDATQGVVQHRRMDRNGARLENTGLGPATYALRAPMFNTIAKGRNENWSNLYPDRKDRLLEALSDRSTTDFIHPELGLRRVKCASFKTSLSPDDRTGVFVDFTLIEDTEDSEASLITENSIKNVAASAVVTLDAQLGQLVPPPIALTELQEAGFDNFTSFLNLLNSFSGKLGQADLAVRQAVGKIDQVIGILNHLQNELQDPISLVDTAIDQIIESLLKFKKDILIIQKSIGFYQTLSRTTLGALSIILQNTTSDLIDLNPQLVRQPTIASFSVIRYYNGNVIVPLPVTANISRRIRG